VALATETELEHMEEVKTG